MTHARLPSPQPPIQVIAHRGASDDAPEHTLAAYRKAIEDGADALECDVRLTADGHTLGTLCAYDLRPRKISTAQIAQMRTLATAAMVLISARPNPSGR